MSFSKTEESGTYLEEFLDLIVPLPNDIQRNFHLMRELDKDCNELKANLTELERRFLMNSRRKLQGVTDPSVDRAALIQDPELLAEITRVRGLIKQKQGEKIDIAEQVSEVVDSHIKKLQYDLEGFQEELRTSGEYDNLGGRPGDQVAFRANHYEIHYLLGVVLNYRLETGTYEIEDVDDEEKTKVYTVPESQVVILDAPAEANQKKFSKGDEVYAIYPDTTTFYPGIVSQGPKRASLIPGLPPGPGDQTVRVLYVQFQDDADETGLTPQRPVAMTHVFHKPM